MSKKVVGKVCGFKPVGTMVFVEMLTAEESSGTQLCLGNAKPTTPQAYVVAVGPAFKEAEWGYKVGDRVMLAGTYNPVPNYDEGRDKGSVLPHEVRGILLEE